MMAEMKESAVSSEEDRQVGLGNRDSWRIEPMPAGLIEAPLDFIFAEHHRQRDAALILAMIADGEFDHRGVRELVVFLETDFAWHIADEEIALFPLLRRCCLPEDEIDAVIGKLADEHREDENTSDDVIRILKARLNEGPLSERDKTKLRVFSEHLQRHLALENDVLLPIARLRMDSRLLELLSDMLKERRN